MQQQSLNDYSAQILNLFKSIQKNFREAVTIQPEFRDFTLPQLSVIQVLFNHPKITLNELSEHVKLSKSTVSGIVDRLEAQDIVSRERPKDNRRTVSITLTERAKEKGEYFKELKTHFTSSILAGATAEELQKIIEGLELLESFMQKNNALESGQCQATKDSHSKGI